LRNEVEKSVSCSCTSIMVWLDLQSSWNLSFLKSTTPADHTVWESFSKHLIHRFQLPYRWDLPKNLLCRRCSKLFLSASSWLLYKLETGHIILPADPKLPNRNRVAVDHGVYDLRGSCLVLFLMYWCIWLAVSKPSRYSSSLHK
jgi:hypothetical protein